jgi:hypothetical protein
MLRRKKILLRMLFIDMLMIILRDKGSITPGMIERRITNTPDAMDI